MGERHHTGEVTLRLTTSDALARLIERLIDANNTQGRQIMATLQDIVDATRQNGEAARAATARVAEDFKDLSQQITDLQNQIANGVNNTAELEALKSGLDEVKAGLDETTANLQGIDPVPGNPPPAAGPGGGTGTPPPGGGETPSAGGGGTTAPTEGQPPQ